jgi:hypothetical protein
MTATVSLTRQRQAVEIALKHARSSTPKTYHVANQSQLDMLRSDLAAAVETLRAAETREAEAVEYAKKEI